MAGQKMLAHRRQRTRLFKGKAGTAACLPVCRVNPNAMHAMLRRKTSISGLHSIQQNMGVREKSALSNYVRMCVHVKQVW